MTSQEETDAKQALSILPRLCFLNPHRTWPSPLPKTEAATIDHSIYFFPFPSTLYLLTLEKGPLEKRQTEVLERDA